MTVSCFFFFFQAEDGIRDLTVTGVQTCALPISLTLLNELSNCLSLERRTPLLSLIDHRQVHDAAIPPPLVNGLTRLAILEGCNYLLDVLNIFIHGSRRQGL